MGIPLPPSPDWLEILTGPNVAAAASSGSVPVSVGRQPNLTFVGALVESDPINRQNVVTMFPGGVLVTGSGGTSVAQVGGEYVVSSSAPQVQSIVGASGVSVSHQGTAWSVTGSLYTGSPGSPGGDMRQVAFMSEFGPFEGWPGAYEVVVGQPFPLTCSWYTDATLSTLVMRKTVTRNAVQLPTQERWQLFAADGTTVVRTFTDSIAYVGPYPVNRTRTQS